jgi:hypothetical protein
MAQAQECIQDFFTGGREEAFIFFLERRVQKNIEKYIKK